MTDKLTLEDIDQAMEIAKRNSCSLEGLRFIVEQLAALDGRAVTMMELTMLVTQAKFALKSERELELDRLRKNADA